MFVLRTGLQGHGKTLNTIKEVDTKAASEGRAVYYHNIRGFNPQADILKAPWQPFEDPHKWYELPENSIIVIDEAQTFFRIRKQSSEVPLYASALETMRHKGHELHCITQSPGLIDHHFRKLCNSHIHYVRGHKGKITKRWEFERVNLDVDRRNHFVEGEATRVLLDKKYFGVYQSIAEGSEHHMRFKPPKALYIFVFCLIALGLLGYRFYQRVFVDLPGKGKAEMVEEQNGKTPRAPANTDGGIFQGMAGMGGSRKNKPLTTEEYIKLRTPRIADVPSSAPLYDGVTQPVTYPRLSCLLTEDMQAIMKNPKRYAVGFRDRKQGKEEIKTVYGCTCYTQQATRVQVSAQACLNYVENGAFDPAKPDLNQGMKQGEYLQTSPARPKLDTAPADTGAPAISEEASPVTGNGVVVVGEERRAGLF